MPHLINPVGRVIAIDDQEEYEKWLKQPNFRAATEQEVKDFIREKTEAARVSNTPEELPEEEKSNIYMATVRVGGKDGYGIAAKHILAELKKLGQTVSVYQKEQKVGFLFHSPQSLIKLENPFKIIYTMFESDRIPDEWKDYLEYADKIIVPSRWCMEVFAKAGFHTEVIPLGYDEETFKYIDRPIKRPERKDFVFLHYNAFNIRKGFLEVYNAFKKAFDPSEPVKLVLKTNVSNPYSRFPYISKEKDPKIVVIDKEMEDKELTQLLGDSDCFVFPSRGEGFGMTPLEAMATGLPVIVPNAHGISEYFNSEFMYEVNVQEKIPAIYSRYKQGVGDMVKCDFEHLAQKMRYIYEHQEEAHELGKKAAEYAKNFTFKKTAQRLNDVFTEYLNKEVEEKKINNVLPLEEVR